MAVSRQVETQEAKVEGPALVQSNQPSITCPVRLEPQGRPWLGWTSLARKWGSQP